MAFSCKSVRPSDLPALFGLVDQTLQLAELRQHGSCQEARAPFADVVTGKDPLLVVHIEVPYAVEFREASCRNAV